MKERAFPSACRLMLAWVVLAIAWQSVPFSEAMTPDAQQVREEHRMPPPPDALDKPSSPLWRSFLWESIPSEWLADVSRQTILEGYEARNWKPLFVTARFEVNEGAKALLNAMGQLDSHAVDPKSFRLERLQTGIVRLEHCRLELAAVDSRIHDTVAALSDHSGFENGKPQEQQPPLQRYASNSPEVMLPDPALRKEKERLYQEAFRAASEVDLALSETLIRYAREMDADSGDKQAQTLRGALGIRELLQAVVPSSTRYQALHAAYARYRTLGEQHPRPPAAIPEGLAPGQSGASVRDLQSRLHQEGFYAGKITGHFDGETQEALRAYQRAHGIEADGKVGQRTREWLNTPLPQKAQMIAASLKALRQSDTRRQDTYLRINIPQFTLEYVREGRLKATHRVIVGKASGKKVKLNGRIVGENHTPPLSSAVQQIVVNPRWYINDRIWRELAGNVDDDPTFYERHGYSRAGGHYAGGAPRVYQEPGPSNPLGQVKFEFPNAYAVFVHDTPKKYLFARSRRDFSHGCVRLENARGLAEMILNDEQNPMAARFSGLFSTRRTTYIKLQEPLPIVIEYVPVSTDDQGGLLFCGDPYGQVELSPSKGA